MSAARQTVIPTMPARRLLAAGMAFVFCQLLWLNAARAGCGDYVFIRDAHGRPVRASNLMAEAEARHGSTPTSPVQLPCSGPNCSSRSELPGIPVPTREPQRISEDNSTLLAGAQLESSAPPRYEQAGEALDAEIHLTDTVFHPPR